MKYYKYKKTGEVAEYLAVGDTITQFNDVIINSYPDCVRVMILDNANSPTIERGSFIPFQDEIEISETEFFQVYVVAIASLANVLQHSTIYKVLFQIDQSTQLIRQKVVVSLLDKLMEGITDQTGTAP